MKIRWFIAIALVVVAAYFALFGGDYGYFEVRRLERDRQAELAKLQELRVELAKLRTHTDSLEHDSATLERLAREKYGLIRKGERLYRFVDSAKGSARRDTTTRDTLTRH